MAPELGIVTAWDALSGLVPGSAKVTGTSNERIDFSDPSIVITPNGSGGFIVQLQADRLGTGEGGIYTLTATATDLAGDTAERRQPALSCMIRGSDERAGSRTNRKPFWDIALILLRGGGFPVPVWEPGRSSSLPRFS